VNFRSNFSIPYLLPRFFRPSRIPLQITHLIKFELSSFCKRFFIVLSRAPTNLLFWMSFRFLDGMSDFSTEFPIFQQNFRFFNRISDLSTEFPFFESISDFWMEFRDYFGFFDLILRFLEFSIEFLDSVHYLVSRICRPP
jgi:hypothetical protein